MNLQHPPSYERLRSDDGDESKLSLTGIRRRVSQGGQGTLSKQLKVAYDCCLKAQPSSAIQGPLVTDPSDAHSLPRTFVSDDELGDALTDGDEDGLEPPNAWLDDLWGTMIHPEDDHTLTEKSRGNLEGDIATDSYQPFDCMLPPLGDSSISPKYYGSVMEALESISSSSNISGGIDGSTLSSHESRFKDQADPGPRRMPAIPMRRLSSSANQIHPEGDDLSLEQPRPAAATMLNRRPLHHPLAPPAPAVLSTTHQMPLEMALVRNCTEPTILTLTSFPFRVTCVNEAFVEATGRQGAEIIGSTFYDLFVQDTDQKPNIATTPSLLGVFNDDIVRVAGKLNPDESSPVFCRIKVHGIMKRTTLSKQYAMNHPGGADLRYFSIKLSPLDIPATSLAAESVVYLPMPCYGMGASQLGGGKK